MALSLTSVGVGYGSDADKYQQFYDDNAEMANRFDTLGTKAAAVVRARAAVARAAEVVRARVAAARVVVAGTDSR